MEKEEGEPADSEQEHVDEENRDEEGQSEILNEELQAVQALDFQGFR